MFSLLYEIVKIFNLVKALTIYGTGKFIVKEWINSSKRKHTEIKFSK